MWRVDCVGSGKEWGSPRTREAVVIVIQINPGGGGSGEDGKKWSYCRYYFHGKSWQLGCVVCEIASVRQKFECL